MLKFYIEVFSISLFVLFDGQAQVQVSYPVWGQVLFFLSVSYIFTFLINVLLYHILVLVG